MSHRPRLPSSDSMSTEQLFWVISAVSGSWLVVEAGYYYLKKTANRCVQYPSSGEAEVWPSHSGAGADAGTIADPIAPLPAPVLGGRNPMPARPDRGEILNLKFGTDDLKSGILKPNLNLNLRQYLDVNWCLLRCGCGGGLKS